jgi:hypothetical protein
VDPGLREARLDRLCVHDEAVLALGLPTDRRVGSVHHLLLASVPSTGATWAARLRRERRQRNARPGGSPFLAPLRR